MTRAARLTAATARRRRRANPIPAFAFVAGTTTTWAIEAQVRPQAIVVTPGSATAFALEAGTHGGRAIVAGSTTTFAIADA